MFSNNITNSMLADDSEGILKVKGLLIGINYNIDPKNIDDHITEITAMHHLIRSNYPEADLELITDQTKDQPTRENILAKLKTMVNNSKPGDVLIFAYSGYSDPEQIENFTKKQNIYPIDFMQLREIEVAQGETLISDHIITEEEINQIISKVPTGVKFLMLSDLNRSWIENKIEMAMNFVVGSIYGNAEAIISTKIIEVAWLYMNLSKKQELWLTPLDLETYHELGNNKYVIQINQENINLIGDLINNPNKSYIAKTEFKKLANGKYQVSSTELKIQPIIINLSNLESSVKALINYVNIYNPQIITCNQHGGGVSIGEDSLIKINNSSSTNSASWLNWLSWFKQKNNNQFKRAIESSNFDLKEKEDVNLCLPYSNDGGKLKIMVNNKGVNINKNNKSIIKAFLDLINPYDGVVNVINMLFSKNLDQANKIEQDIDRLLNSTINSDLSVKNNITHEINKSIDNFIENSDRLSDNYSIYNIGSISSLNSHHYSSPIPFANNCTYYPSSYSQSQNRSPFAAYNFDNANYLNYSFVNEEIHSYNSNNSFNNKNIMKYKY